MRNDLIIHQDIAFERAILSALCQFGLDAYIDIDFITSDTFTDQTNQILFECIKETIVGGGNPDLSTILSQSIKMGFDSIISKDSEISYIRSLFAFPVHKDNISHYASKLTKLKIIRDGERVLSACKQRLESLTGDEDIGKIVGSIEGPISELTAAIYNSSNNKPEVITKDLVSYVDNIISNPRTMMGISTGIPALDISIGGGLRKGGVTVISARYKVGKSTTGIQMGLDIAVRDNIPVLLLDTEMDYASQKNRFIANYCLVDVNDLTTGKINTEQYERIKKAANIFDSLKISHLNISGQSFDTALSMARQWIYREVGFNEEGKANDCLLVYDYLKMTGTDGLKDLQEYQIMGFQMTALHNFCSKYHIPCLSFVQLNRQGDISQSDRIAWLCTSHVKFEEKSPEEQTDDVNAGIIPPYNRKLTPTDSRYGPCLEPGDYINIRMRGEYAKLEVGPTRNELLKQSTANIEIPDIDTVGEDS